jgi:putative ABC transport system permease protein
MRNIRLAFRQLAKSPGFTATTVLTLALGIGANTAIFSVINSTLLQPLPYPQAGELVDVMETYSGGGRNGSVSGGAFKDWREGSTKFTGLAAFEQFQRNLTGLGQPERVTGLAASADYLSVLGIAPALGRVFTSDETSPGSNARVVLLTHGFWRSHFGGDPAVVGRSVLLDQEPFTVVGVLPPRALLQDDLQLVMPAVVDAPGTYWGRDAHWRKVIGRLRPGITAAEAEIELKGIKQRLASEYPTWKADWSVVVTPLQDLLVRGNRPMFVLLFGATGLVLLIACANVSNLLLARGQTRTREMAIRTALGARPRQIVRQVLTESLVLAFAGCALGLGFAFVSVRGLDRMLATQLPEVLRPEIDPHVLLFSVLLATGCGVLFGVLPAWRAARADVIHALKDSERGSSSGARRRAQTLLVVSEFALTLVLLVGAGLFLRSFARLLAVDPGFNPRGTLAFDVSFPHSKYPGDDDRLRFTQKLIDRIRALPGVDVVGASSSLPLSDRDRGEFLSRPGRPSPGGQYSVGVCSVAGDYFAALGIRLIQGRRLTEADNTASAPPVLVIDRRVAGELFPNDNPLGQPVTFLGKTCTVVGVTAPVQHRDLEHQPRPTVYGPLAQFPHPSSLLVRSTLAPATLVTQVRKAIAELDPEQPIANVRTLTEAVGRSLAPRRTALTLLGLFAAVAVGLACLGVYGVITFMIGERSREFSIRSALGAQPGNIVRLVISGAMVPSFHGIAVGLAVALALGRVVESQLFGVKAQDPGVLAFSVALLTGVAALSVYFPAQRAAQADPIQALRAD